MPPLFLNKVLQKSPSTPTITRQHVSSQPHSEPIHCLKNATTSTQLLNWERQNKFNHMVHQHRTRIGTFFARLEAGSEVRDRNAGHFLQQHTASFLKTECQRRQEFNDSLATRQAALLKARQDFVDAQMARRESFQTECQQTQLSLERGHNERDEIFCQRFGAYEPSWETTIAERKRIARSLIDFMEQDDTKARNVRIKALEGIPELTKESTRCRHPRPSDREDNMKIQGFKTGQFRHELITQEHPVFVRALHEAPRRPYRTASPSITRDNIDHVDVGASVPSNERTTDKPGLSSGLSTYPHSETLPMKPEPRSFEIESETERDFAFSCLIAEATKWDHIATNVTEREAQREADIRATLLHFQHIHSTHHNTVYLPTHSSEESQADTFIKASLKSFRDLQTENRVSHVNMLANDFKECERRRRSHQRQYDRIKMKKGLRPFSELEFWNNKLQRFRNDVDASCDKLLAQYDRCSDSPVLSESLSFCGWSGSASSDISSQRGSDVKQQVPRLKVPVAKKMNDIEPLLAAKLAFNQDLASLVPLPSDDGCFDHSISQEQTHVLLPMKNEKRDKKRRGRRPVPLFSRPAHPSRMFTVIHCLRRGIFSWKDIRDEWAFNKSQSERQLLLDMQVEQIASCFEHLETELTSKFSTSQSELQHLFQHMQHLRDSDFQQLQEERQCKFEQEEDHRNREATAQNEYHQAQQRERARGLEKHLELATTDMDLFIRMNEEVVPAWYKRFSIVLEYHREEYKKEAQWREKRFQVLLDNLRGGRSRMS